MSFLTNIQAFSVAFEQLPEGIVERRLRDDVNISLKHASKECENKIRTCLDALDHLPKGILTEEIRSQLVLQMTNHIENTDTRKKEQFEKFWITLTSTSEYFYPEETKELFMNAMDKTDMLIENTNHNQEILIEKFWDEIDKGFPYALFEDAKDEFTNILLSALK
jgi:hypothetical protein